MGLRKAYAAEDKLYLCEGGDVIVNECYLDDELSDDDCGLTGDLLVSAAARPAVVDATGTTRLPAALGDLDPDLELELEEDEGPILKRNRNSYYFLATEEGAAHV